MVKKGFANTAPKKAARLVAFGRRSDKKLRRLRALPFNLAPSYGGLFQHPSYPLQPVAQVLPGFDPEKILARARVRRTPPKSKLDDVHEDYEIRLSVLTLTSGDAA
jgi:hypothetical protein